MKKRNLFMTLGLALTLGVGVAVGVNNGEAREAKAAAEDPISTVYIDFSILGSQDYDFYGYLWTQTKDNENWVDSNQTVVPATLVPGTHSLYQVDNSVGANSIIAVAVTKGATYTKDDWSKVQSQTWDKKPQWDNGIPTQGDENGLNSLVIDDIGGGKRDAHWETRDVSIADGAYLRGKYHGVENWDSNAVLTNDNITESITFDEVKNKVYSVLELHAGDFFKFYRYYNGKCLGSPTTYSIESADSVYYPHEWSGNNTKVVNAGIYYVSMGYGENEHADQAWYYVDNSASAFAYEFLNSMTCDPTGVNEPQFKTGEKNYSWSYFADWYTDVLDDYAKDTFYSAENKNNGTSIEQFVSRYFTILANHGTVEDQEHHLVYTPFLTNGSGTGRASVYNGGISILSNQQVDVTALIVIIASIAAVTVIGCFVFKRKHSK